MRPEDTELCQRKSIAEKHPDWPTLEIGGYKIGPCVHDGWWIENEDGEGMQVSTLSIVRVLDIFWARSF